MWHLTSGVRVCCLPLKKWAGRENFLYVSKATSFFLIPNNAATQAEREEFGSGPLGYIVGEYDIIVGAENNIVLL
jgi:hypothetical protein